MTKEKDRLRREKILRRREKKTITVEDHKALKRGDLLVESFWGWTSPDKPLRVFRYRQDPVPGIHNLHRYGQFLRSPVHSGLRKAKAIKLDPTQEEWTEPPLRKREIVDAWDDIPRTLTRSWKSHRKTQWKD
jgi:hypothetical protein